MKILIADDHGLFRETLQLYIEKSESGSSVKIARDLHETIDIIEGGFTPDVLLLDLRMPGMNGLKGMQKIRASYPNVNVALISGVSSYHDIQKSMDMGAKGFFSKTVSAQTFMRGLKDIIAGEVFMPVDHDADAVITLQRYSGGLSDAPQSSFEGEEGGHGSPSLTTRETDVLVLLMDGASNKDIAKALDIQVVTVKLHVSSLFRKFGVKNRTQVVLKAQKLGYGE
jgi:two-component system nitrate/nitrite response regulator NarL